MLGNAEKFREKIFSSPEGQINHEWGRWLRAASQGTAESDGEKWLHNEQGGLFSDKYEMPSGRRTTFLTERPDQKQPRIRLTIQI